MLALLVRHARAGERDEWKGDDRRRPLDARGRAQAEALVPVIAEYGVDRLLSSPYDRCVQTLEPAAMALGLPLESREELAEGASREDVLGLLTELEGHTPALCTHGDVIAQLLGADTKAAKGSVWELELDGGRVRPRRYLRPPA